MRSRSHAQNECSRLAGISKGTERTARQALRLAKERRGLTYKEIAERAGMDVRNVHNAMVSDQPRTRGPEMKIQLRAGMSSTMIARLCTAMECGIIYRPGDGWHPTEL